MTLDIYKDDGYPLKSQEILTNFLAGGDKCVFRKWKWIKAINAS